MTKRKNDKALDQLIKDARIDDSGKLSFTRIKTIQLYMGLFRDLLYHPASVVITQTSDNKIRENEAERCLFS